MFYPILFLLILSFSSISAQFPLSICAIFKNEGCFLNEWIQFHKLQGVEHFYLYNNNSEDNYLEVLAPYLQDQTVTLIEWPYTYEKGRHAQWIAIQTGAYLDCIKKYGEETEWLAVIDIDEFLFCPSGQKLPQFLQDYRDFGGVGVNWLKFGTSNVEEIPEGSLLIEQLMRCIAHKDIENRDFKSIVQPKHVKSCKTPHYFFYTDGKYAVDAHKGRIKTDHYWTTSVSLDKIRINHYWTRTEKFLRDRKILDRIMRRKGFPPERQREMAEKYNKFEDTAILKFVEPLRHSLGFDR